MSDQVLDDPSTEKHSAWLTVGCLSLALAGVALLGAGAWAARSVLERPPPPRPMTPEEAAMARRFEALEGKRLSAAEIADLHSQAIVVDHLVRSRIPVGGQVTVERWERFYVPACYGLKLTTEMWLDDGTTYSQTRDIQESRQRSSWESDVSVTLYGWTEKAGSLRANLPVGQHRLSATTHHELRSTDGQILWSGKHHSQHTFEVVPSGTEIVRRVTPEGGLERLQLGLTAKGSHSSNDPRSYPTFFFKYDQLPVAVSAQLTLLDAEGTALAKRGIFLEPNVKGSMSGTLDLKKAPSGTYPGLLRLEPDPSIALKNSAIVNEIWGEVIERDVTIEIRDSK